MANAKRFAYEVKESGRGEFHVFDVVRKLGDNNGGSVVGSYKWKFIAEQVANFLSQADDRDEYVDVIVSTQADPTPRDAPSAGAS